MVHRFRPPWSLNRRLGPCFRTLYSRCYGVYLHFIGLLQKVHRPPKYPEAFRLQVAVKVLPGVPLFKNTEFVFILHTPVKVAAPASHLRPQVADQGYDRLRQLLALLSKNLHAYDDQDHGNGICIGPANNPNN